MLLCSIEGDLRRKGLYPRKKPPDLFRGMARVFDLEELSFTAEHGTQTVGKV